MDQSLPAPLRWGLAAPVDDRPRPKVRLRRQGSGCLLAVAALTSVWLWVSQAAAQPFYHLLAQEGEDTPVGYLLGSIHVGRPDFYPLPRAIDEAFRHSEALVVELDVNSALAEVGRALFATGIYGDGRRLFDDLSAAEGQRLRGQLERLALPEAFFATQKPWLAAMILTVSALERAGYRGEWGIDYRLLERARASDLDIVSLETPAQQVALFAELPMADQRALLVTALDELDRGTSRVEALVAAWRAGDEASLHALVNVPLATEYPELYQKLVVARNAAMVEHVQRLVRDGRRPLVVVGAAHLVGTDGLVVALRARGYTLKSIPR
ncbi:MAG: TraB/GumN family protein [Candidatus Competibacterales bacterium]